VADVLAEAVVELEADVDKFNKDFKKSLKQAEKDAQQSTDEIDQSFKKMTGNLGKEFESATREIARQYREQEREAKRVAREIERENARVQREIEREVRQTQREIETETRRVARANIQVQKEYEKEFIASQKAMERAVADTQAKNSASFRNHISTLRKLVSERFSITLGIDTSQVGSALAAASKLGAVLGAVGVGALAGQASIAGIAQLAVVIQDLVGNIALLPAVGASAGIVIGTLTLGLRGLGDAIAADKTKDLTEALKKLSENGQKFVLTVRDLKDEFEELRKSIQQELLAGFNDEVEKLAKQLLPVLSKGFTSVAKELNLSALSLSQFFRESRTIGDIDKIFGNTTQSVFVFRRSLAPLAQAFRDLAAVGSDFLPVIAADLGGAAKRFGDFIAKARETNTLKFMFENAIQAARDLFAIIGNVGGIFNAFLDNARMAFGNRGLLGLIRNVTGSLNDFLNSIEGQVALLKFFDQVGRAVDVVVPILRELGQIVFLTVLPALVRLGEVAAPAVNALLDGLNKGLSKAIPGLIEFVDSLGSVVISLVDSGVLTALGELVRILGTSLGAAIRFIAPTLGDLVNSILLKLGEILPQILPALAKFADAFGKLVIAALPVVDILAKFVSEGSFPTLQRVAEQLTPIIADLAKNIGEVLLPVLPDIVDAVGEWVDAMAPLVDDLLIILVDLLKILVPLLPPIIKSSALMAKALQPVFDLFTDIIDPIAKFIAELYKIPGVAAFMEKEFPIILSMILGTFVVPLGQVIESFTKLTNILNEAGVFDFIINVFKSLGAQIAAVGSTIEFLCTVFAAGFDLMIAVAGLGSDIIRDIIIETFAGIRDFFATAWEIIKNIFSVAWSILTTIVRAGAQLIVAVLTGNFGAIPGIIGGAFQRLREIADDAINRLLDAVRGIPGRINSALGNLGNLLYNAGRDVVQGMINGIRDMIGSLANTAANMAASALNAAKNALLSKSPSKAMMAVGQDFGEGFVIGINDMLKQASSAGAELATQTAQSTTNALAPNDNTAFRMTETLNKLTRDGLGPAATSAPAGDTSAAQTTPVVVTPEVYVYIGDEEIKDYVTEVVDDRDRRKKISLSMGARRTL